MSELSRRAMLAGAGAALVAAPASAKISPNSLKPLIGPGYRPTETDEKGLWQQLSRGGVTHDLLSAVARDSSDLDVYLVTY